MIDSGSISLPEDLIKAPVNQVSIRKYALEASGSREPEEEKEEAEKDWTVFESKGGKKHRERTVVAIKVAERRLFGPCEKSTRFSE